MKKLVLVLSIVSSLLCSGCMKDEKTTVNTVTNTKKAYNMAMSKKAVDENGIVNDAVMLMIEDLPVTYSETLVYILMIKQEYGEVFGDNIWDIKVSEEETFEQMAKSEIINQIIRLKVIECGAKKEKIIVNDEELIQIESMATEYMSKIKIEDQEKYGITLDIAKKVMYNNFLAQKTFDVVTMEASAKVDEQLENYEKVVEEKQDEVFKEKYTKWFNTMNIYVVSELWNMIKFSEI